MTAHEAADQGTRRAAAQQLLQMVQRTAETVSPYLEAQGGFRVGWCMGVCVWAGGGGGGDRPLETGSVSIKRLIANGSLCQPPPTGCVQASPACRPPGEESSRPWSAVRGASPAHRRRPRCTPARWRRRRRRWRRRSVRWQPRCRRRRWRGCRWVAQQRGFGGRAATWGCWPLLWLCWHMLTGVNSASTHPRPCRGCAPTAGGALRAPGR
jgi:hypothetical protein